MLQTVQQLLRPSLLLAGVDHQAPETGQLPRHEDVFGDGEVRE